jgi:hypothetical protein
MALQYQLAEELVVAVSDRRSRTQAAERRRDEIAAAAAQEEQRRRDRERHQTRMGPVNAQPAAAVRQREEVLAARDRKDWAAEWRLVVCALGAKPVTAEDSEPLTYSRISLADLRRACGVPGEQVEMAMVSREEKGDTARRAPIQAGDGVAVVGYVDDLAVIGRRGVGSRHTRGVWDVRPPRPGRARPVNRGRAGRRTRRRGRPPRHGAEDMLRGVLTACRVTGLMARLDLGEQFGNTTMMLGTAGDLSAWGSLDSAVTRRNRPPERRREGRYRRMVCYHCGGRHHVRECPDASETMRNRLMALHRAGRIRQFDCGMAGTAAATPWPVEDMDVTDSSGGEPKSGDGDQGQTTDTDMPTLEEIPVFAAGGDPRQDEAAAAGQAVPMTVNGRRYLGWTSLGGHVYEQPRENREETGSAQRKLDASAAPWQPPLPTSSQRAGLGSSPVTDDGRQALGGPGHSLRRRPRDAKGERRKPTKECYLCRGNHLLRVCPKRAAAAQKKQPLSPPRSKA